MAGRAGALATASRARARVLPRPLLVLMALVLLLGWAAGAGAIHIISQTPYRVNSYARKYQTDEVVVLEDGSYNDDYAYAVGRRVVAIAAVGVLLAVVFLTWACLRKHLWVHPDHKLSWNWHVFWNALLLGCAVGCFLIISYGFRADRIQGHALSSAPPFLNTLIDLKNFVLRQTDTLLAFTNSTLGIVDGFIALDPAGQYHDRQEVDEILALARQNFEAAIAIQTVAEDFRLEQFRDEFNHTVNDLNDKRHQALLALLCVLLGIVGLNILVTLCDAYAPHDRQPRHRFPHLEVTLSLIYFFVVILMWVATAGLYAATAGSADYCASPDSLVINFLQMNPNKTATYFLVCDERQDLVNPYTTAALALRTSLDELRSGKLDELRQGVGDLCDPAQASCDLLLATLDNLTSVLDEVHRVVGADTNLDGHFDTGLLELILNCELLNGKYQAVVNIVCTEFLPSLAILFETFLSFGIVSAVAEFIRLKLAPLPAEHRGRNERRRRKRRNARILSSSTEPSFSKHHHKDPTLFQLGDEDIASLQLSPYPAGIELQVFDGGAATTDDSDDGGDRELSHRAVSTSDSTAALLPPIREGKGGDGGAPSASAGADGGGDGDGDEGEPLTRSPPRLRLARESMTLSTHV